MKKIFDMNISGECLDKDFHFNQYDYGKKLRLHGDDLPNILEIHFSLKKSGGESLRIIGSLVDGAIEADIPDEMLRNEGETRDYPVFVFVYFRDDDSGETIIRSSFLVKSRPKPGDYIPPEQPDYGEQLLANIQNETRQAIEAKDEARTSASGAEESRRFADQASQIAVVAAENATESARIAALAEHNAENAKNIAEEKAAQIEEKANQIQENTDAVSELKGDLAHKLDRPATAQVGQIFRVQSINEDGSYVLEAVDMPSAGGTQEDETWKVEPVLEITIEEECTSIYIYEINGEPFEFEEMAGYVQIPVSSAGNASYGRLCVGLNKELAASYGGLVCMNTNGSPGKNQKGIFEIKKEYGMWHTLNTATTESSWLDLNGIRNAHWDTLGKFASVETITSFTLIPYSGTFSPGGIIKIYGKPAKGVTTA